MIVINVSHRELNMTHREAHVSVMMLWMQQIQNPQKDLLPQEAAQSTVHDMGWSSQEGWEISKRVKGMLHTVVLHDPCSLYSVRYTNMDYLFFSVVKDSPLKVVNVSYNITCQWHCHLWDRIQTLPATMHLTCVEKKITFFMPKFHLLAHVAKCQWKFSFNFIKGVG